MNTQIKRLNGANAVPSPTLGGVVDKFFHDAFGGFLGSGVHRQAPAVVPVNVRETGKALLMEFVVPGVSREHFKVRVSGDMLTVALDEGTEAAIVDEGGWLRREYSVPSFTRSFRLDESFDVPGISANYKDGILHVSLPRKEEAQALHRLIEIE